MATSYVCAMCSAVGASTTSERELRGTSKQGPHIFSLWEAKKMDQVFPPLDTPDTAAWGSLRHSSSTVVEAQWIRLAERLAAQKRKREQDGTADSSPCAGPPHKVPATIPPDPRKLELLELRYRYGERPYRLSAVLLPAIARQDSLAGGLVTPASGAAAPWHRLHHQAVQRLLSVLRSVAALDTARYFVGASGETKEGSVLIQLYAHLEALLLELEDAARQRGPTAAGAAREDAVQRILQCADYLEQTLLADVLLALDNVAPQRAALPDGMPYASYAQQLLVGVQDVLLAEQWPAQLLRSANDEPSSEAAHAEVVADTVLGGGISAVVMRALYTVVDADALNLLGCAARPPLSVTAARLAQSDADLGLPHHLTAEDAIASICAAAWRGDYERLGVVRASLDVQAAFLGLLSRAAAEKHDGLLQLWRLWCNALQQEYRSFFASAIGPARQVTLPHVSALDAVRLPRAGDGASLGPTQQAALRVLQRLRDKDAKGWFATPTFLSNRTDFASVDIWIRSSSFGRKTPQEAFRALCAVLDKIVDDCIKCHGPHHEYSAALTSIRAHLVLAAKLEKLVTAPAPPAGAVQLYRTPPVRASFSEIPVIFLFPSLYAAFPHRAFVSCCGSISPPPSILFRLRVAIKYNRTAYPLRCCALRQLVLGFLSVALWDSVSSHSSPLNSAKKWHPNGSRRGKRWAHCHPTPSPPCRRHAPSRRRHHRSESWAPPPLPPPNSEPRWPAPSCWWPSPTSAARRMLQRHARSGPCTTFSLLLHGEDVQRSWLVCRQYQRFTERFADLLRAHRAEEDALRQHQESDMHTLMEMITSASDVEGVLVEPTVRRHQEELMALRGAHSEAQRSLEKQLLGYLLGYAAGLAKEAIDDGSRLTFEEMWGWGDFLLHRQSVPPPRWTLPAGCGVPVVPLAVSRAASSAEGGNSFLLTHFPVVLNLCPSEDLAVCLGAGPSSAGPAATEPSFRMEMAGRHLRALSSETYGMLFLVGSAQRADLVLAEVHTPELLIRERSAADGWAPVPGVEHLQIRTSTRFWGAQILVLYTPSSTAWQTRGDLETELGAALGAALHLGECWGIASFTAALLGPTTAAVSPTRDGSTAAVLPAALLRQLRRCVEREREARQQPSYGSHPFVPRPYNQKEQEPPTPPSVVRRGSASVSFPFFVFLPVSGDCLHACLEKHREGSAQRSKRPPVGFLQSVLGAAPEASDASAHVSTATTPAAAAAAAAAAVVRRPQGLLEDLYGVRRLRRMVPPSAIAEGAALTQHLMMREVFNRQSDAAVGRRCNLFFRLLIIPRKVCRELQSFSEGRAQ
eukprot:gene7261-5107_t